MTGIRARKRLTYGCWGRLYVALGLPMMMNRKKVKDHGPDQGYNKANEGSQWATFPHGQCRVDGTRPELGHSGRRWRNRAAVLGTLQFEVSSGVKAPRGPSAPGLLLNKSGPRVPQRSPKPPNPSASAVKVS